VGYNTVTYYTCAMYGVTHTQQYGSIFIHSANVASQICEILIKFKLIAVQGYRRSLTLARIESHICNFLNWWLIVTLDVS